MIFADVGAGGASGATEDGGTAGVGAFDMAAPSLSAWARDFNSLANWPPVMQHSVIEKNIVDGRQSFMARWAGP